MAFFGDNLSCDISTGSDISAGSSRERPFAKRRFGRRTIAQRRSQDWTDSKRRFKSWRGNIMSSITLRVYQKILLQLMLFWSK